MTDTDRPGTEHLPTHNVEQELKFEPPADMARQIQAKFTGARFSSATADEILGSLLAALPLGRYTFSGKKKVLVEDLYLDDAALTLFRSRCSLRVRRVGDSVELTLKTPEGGTDAELVRRESTFTYRDESDYENSENEGFAREREAFRLSCGALAPVLSIKNNRVVCAMAHGAETYVLSIDIFTQVDCKTGRVAGPDVEIEIESESEAARVALPSIRRALETRLESQTRPESKYERAVGNLQIGAGSTAVKPATQVALSDKRRVFVVHGHDEVCKLQVEAFLRSVNLVPVVLAAESSGGGTIIEKFERHSHVQFAVVLFTPDDVGHAKSSPRVKRPRARQNVVFELGYFVAQLGRERVAVLVKDDVEILSDYAGVVYIPMDGSGAWRVKLARELKTAGVDVDMNLIAFA